MEFFHASSLLLEEGDLILPVAETGKGFWLTPEIFEELLRNCDTPEEREYKRRSLEWKKKWIYLSLSPVPHTTVASPASREDWWIYLVRPLGQCGQGGAAEVIAARAQVITRLGRTSVVVAAFWENGHTNEDGFPSHWMSDCEYEAVDQWAEANGLGGYVYYAKAE